MKIGVAAPISIDLLKDLIEPGRAMPSCYSFPFTAVLAKELHGRGHDITVFASSEEVKDIETFSGERMRIVFCPRRARKVGMTLDFQAFERKHLRNAMAASDCEVIHAQWTYEFALAAIESGRPSVITAQDNPWQVIWWYRHPYRWARFLMSFQVAFRASYMTGVSPYVENHWRRLMRYRGSFDVVPNALPLDWFAQQPRVAVAGKPSVIMATLNGWGPRKNGEALIKGFALALPSLPPGSRLLLFGAGHGQGEPAEALSKSLGCAYAVDCRGLRPYAEVRKSLWEEATMFVHPSREESFGLAQVEAMAAGLPVLGGLGCGAVPWTLDDGRAGRLADVSRPESLKDAIIEIANNPALANGLAARALLHAREHFGIDAVAKSFESVYRKALAG
jgi:glycosyltransferase involved in cell wall biosynthesis